MSIFEQASRLKLRFTTERGQITVESLWDLPLLGEFSLNEIAKAVSREMKNDEEENFVNASGNASDTTNRLRLEIVKHIIEIKLKDQQEIREAQTRAKEREYLRGLLRDRQDEELKQLSKEELEARLAALEDLKTGAEVPTHEFGISQQATNTDH